MMSRFPGAKVVAVLIFVFLTLTQFERGACYARHVEMPESSAFIQYVVLFFLMSYWLDRDSHEKQVGRVWDMGFFLSIAWPLIIPYHLIKTRGIKRTALILLFVSITYFAGFGITAALCRARQ
jgi:hypothetical protein